MTTKLKSAEHLEEQELNKLLKYLYQNQKWTYYILVRLGVSTALRYSDLSRITWEMVLNKQTILIKEKKTGKSKFTRQVRELGVNVFQHTLGERPLAEKFGNEMVKLKRVWLDYRHCLTIQVLPLQDYICQ
jgi:integrase